MKRVQEAELRRQLLNTNGCRVRCILLSMRQLLKGETSAPQQMSGL
jgi:hypothetical protein